MIFVRAFLLGGILCVLLQLLYAKTKLSIVQSLTIGFCLGGVLTATGLMDHITAWGEGGMILMIIDSGEAVYRWMTAALAGDFSAAIRYAVLILSCFLAGVIGGVLYHKRSACLVKPAVVKQVQEQA